MIALFHEYKARMHVDHTGEQKQYGEYFTFKNINMFFLNSGLQAGKTGIEQIKHQGYFCIVEGVLFFTSGKLYVYREESMEA